MMWFMNHVTNPLVRWILSGPLHGLLSKGLLLIAYQGRKSGKKITLPAQYLQTGNEVWIVVGFPEKKQWWKNFSEGLPVNLCLRGEWVSGLGTALSGEKDRGEIVRGLGGILQMLPEYSSRFTQYLQPGSNLDGFVMVRVTLD
jgi:hypothetical protein